MPYGVFPADHRDIRRIAALTVNSSRFHGVGDGGLLTTLGDLARWDLFWLGRSALGPALPAKLIEQGRRNDGAALCYAWGVSARSHRGVRILSQSLRRRGHSHGA